MQPNNERFDLSELLIHFFRDVDLESDRPTDAVQDFGENNIVVDDEAGWPALFLLRCAVRSQRLWATWSVRKNLRGVFGPRPAICFSEMPLAAFLETSERREAWGQAMSGYALTFPKDGMYALGARPAIYGLTDGAVRIPKGTPGQKRLIPEGNLPLREQYRYVPYNPVATPRVDWLHEREWRWPYSGDLKAYEEHLATVGHVPTSSAMPALDISGTFTKGMGIIVKTREDGNKLAYDVLTLVDRYEVPRTHFEYIMVRDDLPPAGELYRPEEVKAALEDAKLDIKNFLKVGKQQAQEHTGDFARRALTVERSAGRAEPGQGGATWLWFLDNVHPYVRSLVSTERIVVNQDGKYLADLPEFSRNRGRLQREKMATALARQLATEYGLDACYYSVGEGEDPNSMDSFYPDRLDNEMYFNLNDYKGSKT